MMFYVSSESPFFWWELSFVTFVLFFFLSIQKIFFRKIFRLFFPLKHYLFIKNIYLSFFYASEPHTFLQDTETSCKVWYEWNVFNAKIFNKQQQQIVRSIIKYGGLM